MKWCFDVHYSCILSSEGNATFSPHRHVMVNFVVVFAGGYYQQGYQHPPTTVVVQQKPKKGGFLSGNTGNMAMGQFSSHLLCVDVDVYITCTTLSLSLSLFLSVFVCLSLHDCGVWGGMAQ